MRLLGLRRDGLESTVGRRESPAGELAASPYDAI